MSHVKNLNFTVCCTYTMEQLEVFFLGTNYWSLMFNAHGFKLFEILCDISISCRYEFLTLTHHQGIKKEEEK